MKKLLFRTDGSKQIGMGHIIRDLDLADYFIRNKVYDMVEFLIIFNNVPKKLIESRGFKFFTIMQPDSVDDEIKLINTALNGKNYDDIILDLLKYDTIKKYSDAFKDHCQRLICFTDDTYKRVIDCDFVFAFSPNQKNEYYDNKYKTKYFVGLDFVPLKPEYSEIRSNNISEKVKNVLITFGGTDLNNYTKMIYNSLIDRYQTINFTFIIGPGYDDNVNLDDMKNNIKKNMNLLENVNNLSEFIENSDLVICSAGTTLIEILSIGKPALVLPQSERENDHANALLSKRCIIKTKNFGKDINHNVVIKLFNELINKYETRKKLVTAANIVVDGKGMERIGNILLNHR